MTISISINYLNFEYFYRKYKKALTNLGTIILTISISISINYIKRVNRFMNSVFWFIQLGSYTFSFLFFSFLFFPSSTPVGFFFFFFNISIFLCLHCIYTKIGKYYKHLHTQKKGKYCTNFANVYKIFQFLCVYNINLHSKYNVYIKILWKCCDACVNSLWVKIK